jgi:SAM-dependent methyltransferase
MRRKNYTRYEHFDLKKYSRKGFSYYIYRKPADTVILPLVQTLCHKRVLEVGLGAGYYTTYFLANGCDVTGVDINPHIGAQLGIPIVKATADDFSRYLDDKKFDVVASFWMTEYLNPGELQRFVMEALSVLNDGGWLITTIIAKAGWGKFYTFASRLKNIAKFTYSRTEIAAIFFPQEIAITDIPGKFALPFAYLVTFQK